MTIFRNRRDAGKQLAPRLQEALAGAPAVVLALPRGGVPVAYEVAIALKLPLDILIVRKLGTPGQEELAMGAIAGDGTCVLNPEVLRGTNIPKSDVERVMSQELCELQRRERLYRDGRPAISLENQIVVIIDDGLATGASMMAAITAVYKAGAAKIIAAVPVSARSTCTNLKKNVDQIISLQTPENFSAVGMWYQDFAQTPDEEVIDLLKKARSRSVAA